ncbi:MAG: ferredoxin [Sphingomonadales bacterium]|nr:ferredoxin [Sphingomonadales bacterium]MBU3993707.1 (2Fe-2S)-binding protein [Alphaproteobacteria bacterium]
MYVCVCNAIRESDLRAAARGCRGDAADLYASFGQMPQCGQCLDEVEEILIEERRFARLPVRTPA